MTTELPIYRYGTAPEHLRTRAQLAEDGKRPGGPQVAWLEWGNRRHPRRAALFDQATAVAKRPMTDAQRAALAAANAARRTCPVCHQDVGYVVTGEMCAGCEERERRATVTSWARKLLERDPLVLDTETTDLDGYLVQIAVIDSAGNVLLDTLVNPQSPISAEAKCVHGITEEMVADAPTFADLEPTLMALLRGRRVAVYNASFDASILGNEVMRSNDGEWFATTWVDTVKWCDVMDRYAQWEGDWSEYHGSYRWQRLPSGDHTALGDCRATLALLQMIAAGAE